MAMAARRIRRGLIIATTVTCALGGAPVAQGSQHPAKFLVGFDKEDITPPTLPFDYLGGEGYKRVGTSVDGHEAAPPAGGIVST